MFFDLDGFQWHLLSLKLCCFNIPKWWMQASWVFIGKRRRPNFQGELKLTSSYRAFSPLMCRAYVVPAKALSSDQEKEEFGRRVQKWMESRVARHKYLRGGVAVVDVIPKR